MPLAMTECWDFQGTVLQLSPCFWTMTWLKTPSERCCSCSGWTNRLEEGLWWLFCPKEGLTHRYSMCKDLPLLCMSEPHVFPAGTMLPNSLGFTLPVPIGVCSHLWGKGTVLSLGWLYHKAVRRYLQLTEPIDSHKIWGIWSNLNAWKFSSPISYEFGTQDVVSKKTNPCLEMARGVWSRSTCDKLLLGQQHSSQGLPTALLQGYGQGRLTAECRVAWPHLPWSDVLAVAEMYLSLRSTVLGQGCAQLCCPARALCGEGNRLLQHNWELYAMIVLQCNFKVVRDEAFDTFACIYANLLKSMQIAIYWFF